MKFLSIFDYSLNEIDGSELDPYPSMSTDETFRMSDYEKFPSGKENTSSSRNGIAPQRMSDYSFMSLPCESDGTELDKYLTIDDFPQQPEDEMVLFGEAEELMNHSLFHTSLFDEELIKKDNASRHLNDLSHEANCQAVYDISVQGAHYGNNMLPNNDMLSSEKILNWEEAEMVGICAKDSSDCEPLRGEKEDEVELVQLLVQSARMIGEEKYDQAAGLVSKCQNLSCQLGNPTQRLGHYICSALQDRIKRQTLFNSNNATKPLPDFAFNVEGQFDKNEFCSLRAYSNRVLPYLKVMQFTSMQAIIDVVGNAQNIHVIDLGMRTGSHWTLLMQYLAHRSVSSSFPALELLKITAIGMNDEELRQSGKRLSEFADSLAIPFTYKIVEIANIEEIKKGLFTVKSGEALAVYTPIVLRSFLYDPVLLENLLCFIKKLRPRIMVNVEIEAQHNSPCFVNRFSEMLFYFKAYLDMVDASMTDRNDIKRMKHEELITGSQIRNIIVYEGKERTVRHVRNDVWKCLFEQAGFREMSFSFQAVYQARLLLREYASGEYYNLEPNGHAIILRWKGTPLITLSAWSGIRSSFHGGY